MTTAIIETCDLYKKGRHRPRVDHINLFVPEKSVYGFLGPNGAGKSTTIRMLLGLIRADGGTVSLFGEPLTPGNRLHLLQHIGAIVDGPAAYPHLSGQENLRFVQLARKISATRIHAVLDLVELTQAAHQKVREYSMGMKQRLAIAMALLHEPKLLILDEPTNGLDPQGLSDMRRLIRTLPEATSATVLVSSHLLAEIEQMATEVGILKNGRLLFQDALETLKLRHGAQLHLRTTDNAAALNLCRQVGVSVQTCDGELIMPHLTDEPLAELLAYLWRHQVRCLRIYSQSPSLENLFFELTGGDAS